MFSGIRKHFYRKAKERTDQLAPRELEIVEVPSAGPSVYDEKTLDQFIQYLKDDSAFEGARKRPVKRQYHEKACRLLIAKASLHIQALMVNSGAPITQPERERLQTLMARAWNERQAEIKTIVPILEETALWMH